jgi:hypothetical protein
MSFIVRIFFAGLIAFVPSHDGRDLVVLLPEVGDQAKIAMHQALLVVRAAACTGDCQPAEGERTTIAGILFADKSSTKAGEALATAVGGGTAWHLQGSDLSFPAPGEAFSPALNLRHGARRGANGQFEPLPATPEESRDFSWVAELNRILPGAGVVDPRLLGARPPAHRLTARLRMQFGDVSTYRLVRIGSMVPSLGFRGLANGSAQTSYSQALAEWVVAEFNVSGGRRISAGEAPRRWGGAFDAAHATEWRCGDGAPERSAPQSGCRRPADAERWARKALCGLLRPHREEAGHSSCPVSCHADGDPGVRGAAEARVAAPRSSPPGKRCKRSLRSSDLPDGSIDGRSKPLSADAPAWARCVAVPRSSRQPLPCGV